MLEILLSWTVDPGIDISLPVTAEEIRGAYSLLNGADIAPLEVAIAYMESSIPNLRHYLYEVLVTEKRLEGLGYLAYHVKWMDSQDRVVFGTVVEMTEPETLQDVINLSCNTDKFRYLSGVIAEVKLGKHLLKGNADMTMEEQAVRSNYEGIGKNYIEKCGGMFHIFDYTSGSQEELEPIYRGKELPDPNYKQICSFKVRVYKGGPYDSYTLTLPTTENGMDVLKSAVGIPD